MSILHGRPHLRAEVVLGAVFGVDNLHIGGVAVRHALIVTAHERVADALVPVEVRSVSGAVVRSGGGVHVAEIINIAVQGVLDGISGSCALGVTLYRNTRGLAGPRSTLAYHHIEVIPGLAGNGVIRWYAFVDTNVILCAIHGVLHLVPRHLTITVGLARVKGEQAGGVNHLQKVKDKVDMFLTSVYFYEAESGWCVPYSLTVYLTNS